MWHELFDKAELIPPNQTEDEGFAEDDREQHDEKSNTVIEDEKENETHAPNQELKVYL